MKLKVKKISERAVMPSKKYPMDACFDLSILIDENNPPITVINDAFVLTYLDKGESATTIPPNETVIFHTGLKFETEDGYNMKIYVRSSTGLKKNLVLSNGTGVVDTATYRGEVLVGLTNIGNRSVTVKDLERVAQFEIVKTLETDIEEVDTLHDTERGEGGFGSTGGH